MTTLRRFNPLGISRIDEWLDRLPPDGQGAVPVELLSDPALTEQLADELVIEARSFETRMIWAQYIERVLSELPTRAVQADAGMWVWLTVFYFDQVCPPDAGGKRKVGQRARYVPTSTNFRTYYRHLLQGPWQIIRAHRSDPERVLGVLAGALYRPGDIAEQLASRQELVTSGTVMECATRLYIDPTTRAMKRGAGGAGRGSPRRLADILAQFDVTYDIYSMDAPTLLAMLPGEFNRFRAAS